MSVVASVLKELHKQKHAKQAELNRLDEAIAIIRRLGGLAPGRVTSKRTLSAAARRRIIAAQKARWAKWRGHRKGRLLKIKFHLKNLSDV